MDELGAFGTSLGCVNWKMKREEYFRNVVRGAACSGGKLHAVMLLVSFHLWKSFTEFSILFIILNGNIGVGKKQ